MDYKIKRKKLKLKTATRRSGFVSLIALLLANVFLLIGLSVFGIAIKELNLSYGGKESLFAFYAADGGVECALYWDIREDAFNPSSPKVSIECNKQDASITFTDLGGGAGKSEFELSFAPDPSAGGADFYPCAQVVITKEADGNTTIKSYGQNTCRANLRRVERAWKVVYVSETIPSSPPSCAMEAFPDTITEGESSLLSWTSTDADSVSIDNGVVSTDPNDSEMVSPVVTTTYTGTFTGTGGTAVCSVAVTVGPACGGYLFNGKCWYEGVKEASCDATCATHGGCDDGAEELFCSVCQYFHPSASCENKNENYCPAWDSRDNKCKGWDSSYSFDCGASRRRTARFCPCAE